MTCMPSTSAASQVRGSRTCHAARSLLVPCPYFSRDAMPCRVPSHTHPPADAPWKPALICTECIGELIATQYKTYTHTLAHPSCAAEQRRLLEAGPPVNVSVRPAMPNLACHAPYAVLTSYGATGCCCCWWRVLVAMCWWSYSRQDRVALKCDAHGEEKVNCEVQRLWYKSDGKEHSPQLEGALTGQARLDYWAEQRAFIAKEGAEAEAEAGAGDAAGAADGDDDA